MSVLSCSPVESLCFDALLFRFGLYNYFRGVGTGITAVGMTMLLNNKHYVLMLLLRLHVNDCSAQCLILDLGTRANMTPSRRPIND